MKTLSIRQPYAAAIIQGYKDIENRDWTTNYRGPILIHAGKKIDVEGYDFINRVLGVKTAAAALLGLASQHTGGIVGIAELVEIVTHSKSPWFCGTYGWVLKNARPLHFIPCRGQLFLFDFDVPSDVLTIKKNKHA